MIVTISELLKGFIDEEIKVLDEFKMDHRPTIGDMYEGLSKDVLIKVIPKGLDLGIKSGVIYDDTGFMTGQIDCMLVKGVGIRIPYTEDYKRNIKDVIAVLEIKKTLYSNDLEDSFEHLRGVYQSYSNYVQNNLSKDQKVNISSARKTFEQMTGIAAPSPEHVGDLSFETSMIYHALVMEQLVPVRIVLGYHGFNTEHALRDALVSYLSNNLLKKGFGTVSFPNLIISGGYSLVKFNGQPYCQSADKDSWLFYGSTSDNPILVLLELIWTKLENEYPVSGFWGEDLEDDTFNPLLFANAVKNDAGSGWAYTVVDLPDKELQKRPGKIPWEPIHIDSYQWGVFFKLQNGNKVDITDAEFLNYLETGGQNPKQFISDILGTGLVALKDNELKLIAEKFVSATLPDGEFVVAEDNSGRFSRWLNKYLSKK